jgi:hypothetical protein
MIAAMKPMLRLALVLALVAPAVASIVMRQPAFAQAPAGGVEPLHFHHVHLNSVDPKAAADYYPKPFAKSATRTTFNGFEAVKTGNVYILFTKVTAPPTNELTGPQTSVWHFGWNTPNSREYDTNFRKMGLTIAQMWIFPAMCRRPPAAAFPRRNRCSSCARKGPRWIPLRRQADSGTCAGLTA